MEDSRGVGCNVDIEEYYEKHYESVVNSGLVGKVASFYHYLIEKDFVDIKFKSILELGAGKGQHLHFVNCDYEEYIQTDIRLPQPISSNLASNVIWKLADAQDLSDFDDDGFERTIATCLIAHLPNPEKAIKEWRRVTSKTSGVLSIYVPCEPSYLLRLAQMLSTRRKAMRLGIDYSSMHYREHRNHYFFLRALILDVFKHDEIKVIGFPSRFLPFDFKLYEIYQIKFIVGE
jgi:phosphatidylethanolamine/phosphatidyl-N-methylethanolamine N-methyltransferase